MIKPTAEELKLLLREQELKLQAAAQDNFLNLIVHYWISPISLKILIHIMLHGNIK